MRIRQQDFQHISVCTIAGFATGILLASLGLGACSHTPHSSTALRSPSSAEHQDFTQEPEERVLVEHQEQTHRNYFDWPVDTARMTRGFLPNRRKPHLGIDLAAPKSSPIFAAHDGTIIYAGRDFRGYGKMVLIEGRHGWASLYAHFHKINVKEGDRVNQGDIIGLMGRTGRATGVHLHFEIRKEKGPVDPMDYLPRPARMASN